MLGLAACLLTLSLPASAAPLRRVSVDVALEGVGAIAAHVRRSLPRHLARELSQNPIEGYPPGSRLVVRVTEVFLASGGIGRRSGGRAPDALDGIALILDAEGNVLLRKSIAGRSDADTSVANAPYSEPRRVEKLISTFAYWTIRGLQ